MRKLFAILFAILLVAGCSQVDEVKDNLNDGEKIAEETKQEAKKDKHTESADIEIEDSDGILDRDNSSSITEEKYLEVHAELLGIFSDTMDNIIMIIEEGEKKPSLHKSEDWVKSLEFAFTPINTGESLLKAMEEQNKVPESMTDIHASTIEAFSLMSTAGDNIVDSVKNDMDSISLDKGSQAMQDSIGKLNEVRDMLKELQNE